GAASGVVPRGGGVGGRGASPDGRRFAGGTTIAGCLRSVARLHCPRRPTRGYTSELRWIAEVRSAARGENQRSTPIRAVLAPPFIPNGAKQRASHVRHVCRVR